MYPLLDRGAAALSDPAFTKELRRFLRRIEAPYVLFDYFNDGALLRCALADLTDAEACSCGPPSLVTADMLLMTMVLEDWFQNHPGGWLSESCRVAGVFSSLG